MPEKIASETLASLPLFKGATADELDWLLQHAEETWLQAGDVMLQPGENNEYLSILLSGAMRVEIAADKNIAISRIDAGECVGELSVLDGKPVAAYVIADEQCHLLRVHRDDFWKLIDTSHAVARNMLHILSSRIRSDNSKLSASIEQQRPHERSALTDALTSLNNRRWFDEMLPRLMERCRKGGTPLALLVLDVDHFKRYNDSHGHQAGDQALKAVGSCLLSHLRPNDAAVRYGGEEFVVVLPNNGEEEMLNVANRLCEELRNQPICDEQGNALPSISVSIGAALWQEGQTLQSLVAMADAALYQAKESGRNQVVVSQ